MNLLEKISTRVLAWKITGYLLCCTRPPERKTAEAFFETTKKIIDYIAHTAGYDTDWKSPSIGITDSHASMHKNSRVRQNANLSSHNLIELNLVKKDCPDGDLKFVISLLNHPIAHEIEANLYKAATNEIVGNKTIWLPGSLDQAIHRSRSLLNALKMEFGGDKTERHPLLVAATAVAVPLATHLFPNKKEQDKVMFDANVEADSKLTPEQKQEIKKIGAIYFDVLPTNG